MHACCTVCGVRNGRISKLNMLEPYPTQSAGCAACASEQACSLLRPRGAGQALYRCTTAAAATEVICFMLCTKRFLGWMSCGSRCSGPAGAARARARGAPCADGTGAAHACAYAGVPATLMAGPHAQAGLHVQRAPGWCMRACMLLKRLWQDSERGGLQAPRAR